MKTFAARTPGQWRAWLAKHHESQREVWLVFSKRHTGRACIEYEDAVLEALCFGWIDSLVKRLDDERYARKFTPRKPGSMWSPSNRRRYAQLQAEGRLKPAGLRLAPPPGVNDAPRPANRPIPRYIQQAIAGDPAACAFFDSLAQSYRRLYVGWIDSARRPETRRARLDEAVRMLAAGRKLGLK